LAIGSEIPKIRNISPDVVARAQLRGLIDTLADKVVEAKALIKIEASSGLLKATINDFVFFELSSFK